MTGHGRKFEESGFPCSGIDSAKLWLDQYFAGVVPNFFPPMNAVGTGFRREIWDLLLAIPYGEAVTYGFLANIIAKRYRLDRMSAQAVGGAVGANPISIIIPCHRVLGADGSLTGYGGGIDTKIKLLQLEKVAFK